MPYLYAPMKASEEMDLPRLSMQETYKRAANDCDSAAMYLQNVIPNSEYQHPTRIAALALKSRILLYAASDQARYENCLLYTSRSYQLYFQAEKRKAFLPLFVLSYATFACIFCSSIVFFKK